MLLRTRRLTRGAQVLYFLFEDKIKAIAGNSARDVEILTSGEAEGTREYFCAVYREGQRRVMREAMQALEGEEEEQGEGCA